jgi:hypothetical protein
MSSQLFQPAHMFYSEKKGLFGWQPSFTTIYAATPKLVASKSTAT